MQLGKFILHLCSLIARNLSHRSRSCPSSQGAWAKVWAQLCHPSPFPPVFLSTKFQIWPGPETLLQFLISKPSIKCNFWKPGMNRLKGRLIFKVIQSTKHWAWLTFSHKYYGKRGFLFNEGWTPLADCLASVFACCWMYFKLLFKPPDALPIPGRIPVKKSMSCRKQLLGNGAPQTRVCFQLPLAQQLGSFKSVGNLIHPSPTCFLATSLPV